MAAPTTTWRSLDPSYFTATTYNNFLQYDSNFYVIDPVTLNSFGYSQASTLSNTNMLSFGHIFTAPNFSTTQSQFNFTLLAWSNNGWDVSSAANFAHDMGTFIQRNFVIGTPVNPFSPNINILLAYTIPVGLGLVLPIVYAGNDALGVST